MVRFSELWYFPGFFFYFSKHISLERPRSTLQRYTYMSVSSRFRNTCITGCKLHKHVSMTQRGMQNCFQWKLSFSASLIAYIDINMSLVLRKRSSGFSTRSDTNRAGKSQKMARGSKFRILEVEGLYYPCSENKGADQLCGYRTTDLRLCFWHMQKSGFLTSRLIY